MDASLVKLSCNWSRIGGCEIAQAVQLRNADSDVFTRPTLDELVKQENAILLNQDECTEYCELSIQLFPHYKIQAFSLVCNVSKVEVFQGHLKEYLETAYGTISDDCDDEQFKTYRYDVEVEKSGITELTIKYLTTSVEVCLFGIILQTAPNPNGITTLVPSAACINIDNVQCFLQNSSKPLTPASEKCKQFFELMTKTKPTIGDSISSSGLPTFQQHLQQHCNTNKLQNLDIVANGVDDKSSMQDYIDYHFRKMEERLNQRLTLMEERQMEKFDCLLKMLEKLVRN